jgi:hypothetical protein
MAKLQMMECAHVSEKLDCTQNMPPNSKWMGPIGDENAKKIRRRSRIVFMGNLASDTTKVYKYMFADAWQVDDAMIYKYVRCTTGEGVLIREVSTSRLVLTITTQNDTNNQTNVIATSMAGRLIRTDLYGAQDICRGTEYHCKLKKFLVENNFVSKSMIVSIVDIGGKIIRGNRIIKSVCGLKKKIEKKKGRESRSTTTDVTDASRK